MVSVNAMLLLPSAVVRALIIIEENIVVNGGIHDAVGAEAQGIS